MEIELGDVVRLRKKHPCGGDEWQVTKVGVDIWIKCLTCQRQVLLERGVLEHRLKALVSKGQTANKAEKGIVGQFQTEKFLS